MPSIDVMAPPGQGLDGVPEEPQPPPPPVIGIIYPPPEVRNIVDKTASFVARNGPEFEARIRQNELGNPKFNFLNSGDPYHAYYQHKVKEIREGKGPDPSAPAAAPASLQRGALAPATAARQQELLKAAAPVEPPPPRDPPPDFEFIADPPSISALELDIVKLTAQFVARNGRQFLTDLMKKEERNHQFDFLRPQHSLFQYFTRLLEQYTKVLLPPKELAARLGAEVRGGTLEAARTRAAWHAHQARRRAQDEARQEKERLAYASIDWHDFVVVETVDYPAGEGGEFPPPTTPLEVGARVLAQERGEDLQQDMDDTEMQLESSSESESDDELAEMEDRTQAPPDRRPDDNRVQDMEEDSSSSEEEAPPPPPPPPADAPLPPRPDRVVVKKYDPKRTRAPGAPPSEEWLVSPITGEKIPANKVAEHVRIGLLDPRWLEQRDRAAAERTDRDEALAPGAAIEASLKQLAERRTDIFGVGDEETAIGKKIGEEERRRDERVTWDGHTSSVEAATRAARAHITLEDQIQQIHKVKGLLPDEEKEKIGPKPVSGGGRGGPGRAPPPPAPARAPAPPAPAPAPPPVILQPIPSLMRYSRLEGNDQSKRQSQLQTERDGSLSPSRSHAVAIPSSTTARVGAAAAGAAAAADPDAGGGRARVRVRGRTGRARPRRGGPARQAAAHRGRARAGARVARAPPRRRAHTGGAAAGAGARRVAAGRARAGAGAAARHHRRRAQEHAAAEHQHAHRQAEAALRGLVLQRHQHPGVLQRASRRRDTAAGQGARRTEEVIQHYLRRCLYCS